MIVDSEIPNYNTVSTNGRRDCSLGCNYYKVCPSMVTFMLCDLLRVGNEFHPSFPSLTAYFGTWLKKAEFHSLFLIYIYAISWTLFCWSSEFVRKQEQL